ncbi:MAG: hypothetical protein ACFFD2_15960 [Promethearchaeota archaeon]
MDNSILFFNGITALDTIGPYEVLKYLPNAKILIVVKTLESKFSEKNLDLIAKYFLEDITKIDILIITG